MKYNTERESLTMPEYGRSVMEMVNRLKTIEDRGKRSEQAAAIVRVMELLNPQVRQQEDFRHKLWDHLFIIGGFDLDIDSPYPCPEPARFETRPVPLPMKGSKIRATHYGRNIERVIELIAAEPEGEVKESLIRGLATYMRQQYLIWNKDSVADETIFHDIEKLSDGRVIVPEGVSLTKLSADASYSRPGMNLNMGQGGQKRNRQHSGGGRRNYKKKQQ